MNIVRVEKVTKQYKIGKTIVHALKEANLTVKSGEFSAIAGPSGSGKTTLLNLIGCIETPTSGTVYLENDNVGDLSGDELSDIRAMKISFIFQRFNLLPMLSARENIEFALSMLPFAANNRRELAEDALAEVGLSEFADHKPLELSGGQQQRVAIARAIVTEPILVLADEPTANLDQATGQDILKLMQRINKEHKTTFLFSTHDNKIMKLADRVVEMRDGVIEGIQ